MTSADGGGPTKARRARGSLSRDMLLDRALAIIDADGLDALNMRRLADELDASPMSLYRHVSDKDALLNALALIVFEGIPMGFPEHLTWDRRLELAIKRLYEQFKGHPGIVEIIARQGLPYPAYDDFRELLLGILLDGGFETDTAVQAIAALGAYVSGFAQVQQLRGDSDNQEIEARRLSELHPGRYPRLSAASAEYASRASDVAFELGLHSLIRGLAEERALPPADFRQPVASREHR